MKKFSLFALLLCALPAGADVLIEAEANPTAGDLKIIADTTASGGKAVSMPRDWNPVVKAPLPQGEAFSLWIRYKGGAVQLKSTPGGAQKELKWLWDNPAQLEWKSVGRFTREQLGEEIIVIRGGGGAQGPVVDALFITTDEKAQPPIIKASDVPVEAAVALGMIEAPPGTLVEAERGAAGEIIEDKAASGGKVVARNGDWQPVVQIPVPQGEAFKIWVRHKGGPFAIKALADGKMQDNWRWAKPEKYAWTEAGVYTRESLGEKLNIIRNNDAQNSLFIDAVVFSPDQIRTLPPFEPDAKLAPLKLNVAVDWNTKIGAITPLHWGTNDYEILDPQKAGDAKFQQLLGEQKFALIRIHNAGISDAWTNTETRSWDVPKIKAGFAASTGYGDAKIILNIAKCPKWLSADEILTPAEEDEFAALVGKLVKIMRDDVKRPIAYWELLNEREEVYEKAGKLDDLWRLFNKLAAAVRKEDPNAKIGGPALTWPKAQWLESFLKSCGKNIDFLTWHNYASGDIYDSNEKVLSRPEAIAGMAKGAVEAAQKFVPNKKLETFLTELNVKWTWDPMERRHGNNVGAAFLASTVKGVALSGTTGITHWHAKGGAYGMINGDNTLRAPAYLYRWGREYLIGDILQSRSDDEKLLELFPVQRQDGTRALLLINKAPRTVIIPDVVKLFPLSTNALWIQRIDAETTKNLAAGPSKIAVANGEFSLPGYSLTLVTSGK
jgi:hypothetical protein